MAGKEVRIGYTLWPKHFDLVDPGAFLDEAEGHGVDSVEIPFFACRMIADSAIAEPAVRIFENELRGRSLGRSAHALLSINLMDTQERLAVHEGLTRACIELTARLGARNLVLHCGQGPRDAPDALEAAYGRQRDALSRLGDFAAEHGVLICLETIWSFGSFETALPGRLAEEIRAVGHPAVRATLDYAHAALQCSLKGADLLREVKALAPLSPHLHLNDCYGIVRDVPVGLPGEALAYASGDLHLPIGWGTLPWERLLTEPSYPDDLILNDELHPSYWSVLGDDVTEMQRLARLLKGKNEPADTSPAG